MDTKVAEVPRTIANLPGVATVPATDTTSQLPRLVVHNSDLMVYKRCRQQWDFTSPLRRNLEPSRPVEPLEFGTIWHRAVEDYYTTGLSESHREIDRSFALWESKFPDIGPEDEEELKVLRDLAHGMIDNYDGYAQEKDDFEIVWHEKSYEVHLFDTPTHSVYYGFKPDALLERNGLLYLGEWKSAKTLPGDRTDYLLTDDQVGRYLWGIREAEGIEVEGAIYRVSRKAAPHPLKPLKKGGFSIDKRQLTIYDIAYKQLSDEYPSRIPPNYLEYLTYLKTKGYSDYFFNEPVRRNPAELENIGRSLKAEALEMISDPYIHRTPSSYNCNYCAFVGPCITRWEGRDVETVLKGNYKEREPVGH